MSIGMTARVALLLSSAQVGAQTPRALEPTGFIALPAHTKPGGFDHADLLSAERRLFVAHTANDSVDVIDVAQGRLMKSIPNLVGVAGVLTGPGQVFTSNRGEDTVGILSPDGAVIARVPVPGRPNGLAFDPTRGLLLVGGTAPPYAAVTVVELRQRRIVGKALVPGRTRWAVYDAHQSLFFVNIADPPLIVAIDPAKPTTIARRYDVPAAGPHGLALDAKSGRLLVACDGKKVVSLDARTGKVTGQTPISGAPDVVFLDEGQRRLYVAVGDPGVIDVLDIDRLARIDSVTTEPGAHTIAFDPQGEKVYAFLPGTHRAAVFGTRAQAQVSSAPLALTQRIPLPGVSKVIDHLAVDSKRGRLYVAAQGNGSVEVIDLGKGSRVRSITGLAQPRGVIHLADVGRVIVAAAGGVVQAFDDVSLEPRARADGLPDADNVRYDSRAKRLYVGYGDGALAVLDPQNLRKLGEVKLPGHPESFRLEDKGPLIYINVPATKDVVIFDRAKNAVISTMPLGASRAANYPMALDESTHRLFIGTRTPPLVVVADTQSHPIAEAECVGDADDLFFDAARQRLYLTGGEGFVDVLDARPEAGYHRIVHIPSARGARTSLWVPELSRLYVAAPGRDGREAALLVYQAPSN